MNPPSVRIIPDNNVNSIALTPRTKNSGRYLIFSPLTSFEFFAIKANDIKNQEVRRNSIIKIAGKLNQHVYCRCTLIIVLFPNDNIMFDKIVTHKFQTNLRRLMALQ